MSAELAAALIIATWILAALGIGVGVWILWMESRRR